MAEISFACINRIFTKTNFTIFQEKRELEDLCIFIKQFELDFNNILRRFVEAFLLLLILITLFGKIREKYKWIVLHAALWNLFVVLCLEIQYSFLPSKKLLEIMPAYPYISRLALASFLPLAINRYVRLFSKNHLNSFRKICIFLIIFDAIICGYIWVMLIYNYNTYIEMVFNLLIIIPTFVFSILIFIKLQKLKKTATGNYKSTLNDLQKAAIVCLVQPIFFLSYMIMILVGQYFNAQIASGNIIPFLYFKIYLIISRLYTNVNFSCILIDTLLLLFVLRTYRASLAYFFTKIFNFKLSSSHVAFISTSNQNNMFVKTANIQTITA